MQTKPFTLIVCPFCSAVVAVDKIFQEFPCPVCNRMHDIKDSYKLGLKKIEKTGEELWVGVKED